MGTLPIKRDSSCTANPVAVCDLGTFSGLILLARPRGRGWETLVEERHTVDLWRERDDVPGVLSEAAIARALPVARRFGHLVRTWGIRRRAIVCTAAVREASNRAEMVERLKDASGCPVVVLSARREALLTAVGAQVGLRRRRHPALIIDIGGGSTEVISSHDGHIRIAGVKCGAARATGLWQAHMPRRRVQRAEFFSARASKSFRSLPGSWIGCSDFHVIGVGGTIVTLAAIHAGLRRFDAGALHGSVLRRRWIGDLARRLTLLTPRAVASLVPFARDRARVLTAGTFLWEAVLNHFNACCLTVSVRGVRWGCAVRLMERGRIPSG